MGAVVSLFLVWPVLALLREDALNEARRGWGVTETDRLWAELRPDLVLAGLPVVAFLVGGWRSG
ncbi:hypothetical protein [Streptoalloteichus tenebrarius]|uniref:hypothetical protein n=1 Tax=Streptoalloteichus tenebrarius (strain ATCC 17920 / DSM 40477 / JCM 4838 / CBS 697.72 / NBRC 16177 / NCIMB 11028 / NRRL B-12390 / A12253. 1 / ISP 5477) TaxID=1933 RepID=UPI0020A2D907|nr:hypothetical protein [Streptoalloteichus tenebrarius]